MAKIDDRLVGRSGTDILTKKPVIERTGRWVRTELNDEFVADSKRVLLMRESSRRLGYWFPEDDVRTEFLEPGHSGSDGRQYYDIHVWDRHVESAAWSYPDPDPDMSGIKGHITFHWNKMDHWYEEEEEVFVHPRDPYHRIDTLPSSRQVRIEIEGIAVAESSRPYLLFETGLPTRYYIPLDDIQMNLLTPSEAKTVCPYKGVASYWSLESDGVSYRNIVWSYEDPIPESPKIRGLLCFFNEKVDLYVDGELQERPETPWSNQK
jgi:uncharacterized protein (DUF427 family)